MRTNKLILVLIHGHGVDASIWDGIYADLLMEATLVKPDFSRTTAYATVDAYADALYEQLQAAQLQDVVLVGHSMGGYIALAFAERYPDMLKGLVLFHSTATADDESRKEVRRQAIEGMEKEGAEPFIKKTIPKMVAADYPAEKIEELVNRYKTLPAEALIAGMKAIANRPDRTDVLRNAQFPVLLLLGKEDQLMPYEKLVKLAELSDRIQVETIENVGHLGMIEKPDVSASILRAFTEEI